jgi:transposase/microcompartment protein CcmL/EutN
MDFITPQNRQQITFSSLEDKISADNPVCFLEAFVEHLELEKLSFVVPELKTEGRPRFEAKLFLKIYLYGYLNGIRSSRKLEKECARNIELQWLCGNLAPNYHSIADFRKDNSVALQNTFKLFVLFLKEAELLSCEIVAIDGTKVRAHNSKKNNYNQKKIDRHFAYIEEKTQEYLKQLDENDIQENPIVISDIKKKIAQLQQNKVKYTVLEKSLTESGEPQMSTTDKDARALLVQGQVVEVCYNVQAGVDKKYKLVISTHTINRNDRNALSAIAIESKTNLQVEKLLTLNDKGYHNGRELQTCKDNNITTIVAQQEIVNSNTKGTTPEYLVTHFKYDKQADTYQCPEGQLLKTLGTWHKKTRDDYTSYLFKKYRTPACKTCPVKHLCTGKEKGGREIDRSEFAEAVEENAQRYKNNKALYRERQEINEHIFGTIKRKWGYYYTNLKGLKKVNGEMSLIMLVYNIKRCINILGLPDLITKLKKWQPNYEGIVQFILKTTYFKLIYRIIFIQMKLTSLKMLSVK